MASLTGIFVPNIVPYDAQGRINEEELLCTSLFMGGDGGTLSSAGVVPEVIMRIHDEARAGNWAESKRVQFKLLDLFSLMVNAPNFPEGFRAGYEVRGFTPGRARFPLAAAELELMADIRARIACVLKECGYPEAAKFCGPTPVKSAVTRVNIEAIVRDVVSKYAS